jgi:predicted transcriptional regulator
VREQAAARRATQRRQCGVALAAMRDRGQSVREIARLAGVSDRTVRELIREAEQSPPPASVAAEPEPTALGAPLVSRQAGAPAAPRDVGGVGGRAQDGEGQR